MKVVYFQDPQGNFGDELNRWLWPRVFQGCISGFGNHTQASVDEFKSDELLFYGIGTILDDRIPSQPRKIIFGSGSGYGRPLLDLSNCEISFVRGRRTAEALGISTDKALTDPAILLRRFFEIVPEKDRIFNVSFMPHYTTTAGHFWEEICQDLGINYISPLGFDVEGVIRKISSSRLIIAEAMHGAIVADTFRVPWIPVTSVPETNPFKWHDWCDSLDLEYQPKRLTPIFENKTGNPIKRILNSGKLILRKQELRALLRNRDRAILSKLDVLDTRQQSMDQLVQDLQNRFLNGKDTRP